MRAEILETWNLYAINQIFFIVLLETCSWKCCRITRRYNGWESEEVDQEIRKEASP